MVLSVDEQIEKCHELLDNVNIPPDTDGETRAEELFNRLSIYIEVEHIINDIVAHTHR
jgi:hypothetical protein